MSTIRKYARTLMQYEVNTGHPHTLASGFFGNYSKRATTTDSLTDYENDLWYGAVQVGTPAKTFTADVSLSLLLVSY